MNGRTALVLVALTTVGPGAETGRAWDDTGHMAVAALAFRDLDGDEPIRTRVRQALEAHPHFDTYLKVGKPDGVDLDQWVWMRAATWPDWVRDKPEFHRPTWHYVNKPLVVLDGDDPSARLAIETRFSSRKENHGDILTAFPDCRRVVRDRAADPVRRAVRLCWVIHLAGDIHQPLHATALCTKGLPGGDAGGNLLFVRRPGGGKPLTLHSYWDNLLDGGAAGADLVGLTRDIRDKVRVTDAERRVGDIGAWAEESFELARDHAYLPGGKLVDFVLDLDPSDHHPPTAARALDRAYEEKAIEVARKRVRVAGARLADVLTRDLKD